MAVGAETFLRSDLWWRCGGGERNVFQALNSITPFAFALGPVHWSPLVSDVTVSPGTNYDFEQILEYDPKLAKLTTIGTLVKVKPYRNISPLSRIFGWMPTPFCSRFPTKLGRFSVMAAKKPRASERKRESVMTLPVKRCRTRCCK